MKKLALLILLLISPLRLVAQLNISGNPPLPVSYGGTGAATLTGIVTGNGTAAMTATLTPTITTLTTTNITGPSGIVSFVNGAVSQEIDVYGTTTGTHYVYLSHNGTGAALSNYQDEPISIGPNNAARWSFRASAEGYDLIPTANATSSLCSSSLKCLNVTGVSVTSGVTSTVVITTANLNFRGNSVLLDGLPTCTGNGCVMAAASTNTSMNMTTTTTGAVDITVTFSTAFAHAPSCFANNNTTGNILRATTVVAGSLHIQGVAVAGDTFSVGCFGN